MRGKNPQAVGPWQPRRGEGWKSTDGIRKTDTIARCENREESRADSVQRLTAGALTIPALLIPQRDDRVDSRGAEGGDGAGEERYGGDDGGDEGEGERIGGLDAEIGRA